MTAVVWTKLPIIGMPGMECPVRTTDDGRTMDAGGDPLPMTQRPRECGQPSRWMIGQQLVCQEHAREAARLMGDDIDAIEAAWREDCL